MKIQLADGVSVIIPASVLIPQMRQNGYEVTDVQPTRGDVGPGSLGKKLYDKVFFDKRSVTFYEVFVELIPKLITSLINSEHPAYVTAGVSNRFTAAYFSEFVAEKYPGSLINEMFSKTVLTGRMMATMAKETPLLGHTVISGKRFYVWKPFDPAWVAKGAQWKGIKITEEQKAQRAYYRNETYTPTKLIEHEAKRNKS